MIDWATLSFTFKTGPQSVLPSVALVRACTVAALRHEDIISDLSPVFNSIPELCTSSGPSLPTKVVPITRPTSSVTLGPFSSNAAPPLGSSSFPRHGFIPPELLHSWDPLSSWSSASDTLIPMSEWGGSPATVVPIPLRDHVNNQRFLGVTPRSTATGTPCQVEDDPRKSEIEDSPRDSEGRQPFNMDTLTPCPTGALPHKPFDLDSRNLRQGEVSPHKPLDLDLRGPRQGEVSPHKLPDLDTRNPRQGGVSPHKMEDPCEERTSDHLLDSPLTHVTIKCLAPTVHLPGRPRVDRTSAWLPDSLSPCATSQSPVPTAPVPVSFVPPVYSVTSPLCPLPPQTSATLLTNTQATSHEKPVDTPIVPGRPRSAHIEEVDDEDAFIMPAGPEPVGYATIQHVDDLDPISDPELPVQLVPRPTNDTNEDTASYCDDEDTLPFLGDPEHEFFSKMTPPSISLIGAAAFKQLIDAGEQVYTINIQLTSDYLDIAALRAVGNQPAPMS